jgi:hypothetical protein
MKDEELEALLEEHGWEIQCYSPFELRQIDGESVATGEAAQILVDHFTPRTCNPRGILSMLDEDDKYYIDKLNILHSLITNPNVHDIIPKHIVAWCKAMGFDVSPNYEDGGAWWSCGLKDPNDITKRHTYSQSLELAEHIYNWLAKQKYGEEALLHAAVCCDITGVLRFRAALAKQIDDKLSE